MRFHSADPDISTIFNRISSGDWDLQPDFQRGEVWSLPKQQRLIDTLLRGWIIPPILLVPDAGRAGCKQVLDGQQRLATIRDFKNGAFPVNGDIEPIDQKISALHGMRYSELPVEVSRALDSTTIKVYEILDFLPEEPAEIFFRFNQPTALTAAEKRNSFFGPVRTQIREVVEDLMQVERKWSFLGFSNSRMAYDDVLARFANTLENGSLRRKVTAATIESMYRRSTPIDDRTFLRMCSAVNSFSRVAEELNRSQESIGELRLNKATLFSWLLFFSRLDAMGDVDSPAKFFQHFELISGSPDLFAARSNGDEGASIAWSGGAPLAPILSAYHDRSTSRVADVSSVLIRDFALWATWVEFSGGNGAGSIDPAYGELRSHLAKLLAERRLVSDSDILSYIDQISWGEKV